MYIFRMSRVVSKNLFNYQLNGVKTEEVIAIEALGKAKPEDAELKALKEQVEDP